MTSSTISAERGHAGRLCLQVPVAIAAGAALGHFASGVVAALKPLDEAFIAQVILLTLVAGMAPMLGVDRFLSESRSLANSIGNAVATIVVARWEGVLGREAMARAPGR